MSALREIKYEAHHQDANKAWGKAECFISIEAACQVSALFNVKHEQGNALTILKKFCLDINVFTGSL